MSLMIDFKKTVVIAEAGVNHNGELSIALELVDAAAAAGADFVKFQTYKAEKLATASLRKARYQMATSVSESQVEMLRRLELSLEAHSLLVDRCSKRGIKFLSSAFDLDSLEFLGRDLQLKTLKLGSGELTNAPILLAAARSGMNILLSTGMATLSEVEEALGVLAFGMIFERQPKSRHDFAESLCHRSAWEALSRRVTLLQCTTEYPAPVAETNLRAIDTMRSAFGLPVGYSDHTEGNAMSIAAVARGAVAIEKHFTLDRTMEGPDHTASMEPDRLAELVREIRSVELGLGNGIKQPGSAEIQNRPIVRKCVVAARDIAKGRLISLDDLSTKRVEGAISAMALWDLVGRPASQDYLADEPIIEAVWP